MAKQDGWTVGAMLEWMSGYLASNNDPDSLISARWLISDATGLSMMQLYTNIDQPLTPDELNKLRVNVKSRAEGQPLQYITGKTSFRFIDVLVRPGVLIPRPETEVLVSEVLSRLPRKNWVQDAEPPEAELLACDLCTGTGCIAASLAYENPLIKVLATDISPDCVALANENIESLGLTERASVIKCDLGDGIDEAFMGSFDAVVSNPPYIPSAQMADLPSEVGDFEPTLALDGGKDGLDVFRRISSWALSALRPEGFLACELHEETLDAARDIALSDGFAAAEIATDLNDLPRVLIATKG